MAESEEDEGNAAFGALHEEIENLTDLLNQPVAEGASDPEDAAACLDEIKKAARAVQVKAEALTVADFEEEYPDDVIEGKVVEYV